MEVDLSPQLLLYIKKHLSQKYANEVTKIRKTHKKSFADSNNYYNMHKEISDELFRLNILTGGRRVGPKK